MKENEATRQEQGAETEPQVYAVQKDLTGWRFSRRGFLAAAGAAAAAAGADFRTGSLEWEVVVGRFLVPRLLEVRGKRLEYLAAALVGLLGRSVISRCFKCIASSAEEQDPLCDDFRCPPVPAFPVLPFSRLEPAFDVYLAAFLEIPADELCAFSQD